MTPDQEKRFLRYLCDAFAEMDEKSQASGKQLQNAIFTHMESTFPSDKLNKFRCEIKDSYKLAESFNEKYEGSFLDLFESTLKELSGNKQILGNFNTETVESIYNKYIELKAKFLLWDADNNINSY
jgi:hypothetical protein